MSIIVSVHTGFGSMAEAADATVAVEVPDADTAKAVLSSFHARLASEPRLSEGVRREVWATVTTTRDAEGTTVGDLVDVLLSEVLDRWDDD